jgi:hypothetical protein
MHFVALEWSADCNADGIVDYGQILAGELEDLDGNGVPDCCDAGVSCNSTQTAVQWRVEDGGNGHWYLQVQGWAFWEQAHLEALSNGGTLVTITSVEENEFVASEVSSSVDYWMGGLRVGQNWTWITGEAWSYTAWNCNECHPSCQPDYPNEAFLHAMCTIGSSHRWNNYGGDRPSYIIEWSADCNADGVVDYGQILAGELEDLDGNGVPDCCDAGVPCAPCAADLDGNGAVDGVDLAVILSKWGTNGGKDYPQADIDGDGTIGGADLALVLGSWGACP